MLSTTNFRKALLSRLAELDKRMLKIESELDEPNSKDWEEMAVEREGDEVLEQLGQNGREEVARIRAALQRIRDGSYGTCARCGEPISAERLKVLPDTALCAACAASV